MELFQQRQEDDVEDRAREVVDETPLSAGDPVALLAAGSVVFAWYRFYVRGDREGGIFVGLWAPTLLTAASYLQQKDAIMKLKRFLSSF